MASLRVGQPWKDDPTQLILRPFEATGDDLAALTMIRNATLRATTPPEDHADAGGAELDAYYRRGDYTLEGNAWLLFLGTRPAAAAIVYPAALFHDRPPGNFHLYVVPEYVGHGLGSRLLAHLEQAAAQRGYPVLETTIASDDVRSTNFLVSHGFKVFGHSLHLVRHELERVDRVDAAPGYEVRSLAELGEPASFFQETANRLGAYDPNYTLMTGEETAALAEEGGWDPGGILFLVDPGDRVIGVVRAALLQNRTGYLSEIRLEPASRGKGLGRLLVSSALAYLASAGATRAELDTGGDNTPAYNLALKAGFREARHWQHFMKTLAPAARAATS